MVFNGTRKSKSEMEAFMPGSFHAVNVKANLLFVACRVGFAIALNGCQQ